MNNTDSILSMTEHGAYVWPSYVIVALVMIGLVIASVRSLKQTERDLARAEENSGKSRNEAEA